MSSASSKPRLARRALSAVSVVAVVFTTVVVGHAAGPEPGRLRVTASLFDDVVRRLLPIDIVLVLPAQGPTDGGAPAPSTPAPVALTELRYCGVSEKGNGRWRAVLRADASGGAGPPVLSADDGCRPGLGDLSRRLAEQSGRDDGVVIADVEGVWRPWEVRLSITRLSVVGSGKPGEPRPLAAIENRRDLLVVPTANLKLFTDAGESLTFHVALSFGSDAIDAVVVAGDNGAGPPVGRPATSGHLAPPAGTANVAADIPHAFANQILRQLTVSRPMAVPVDGDVIDVQNVSVAATPGGLAVMGLATPRSLRESVRLTIQVGGEEARVSAIRADPQLESCAGMGTIASLGCSARNAGRSAAAAALGAALTHKYQGQFVRDLAGPQTIRFELARGSLEFQGDLTRASVTGRSIVLGARFAGTGGSDH